MTVTKKPQTKTNRVPPVRQSQSPQEPTLPVAESSVNPVLADSRWSSIDVPSALSVVTSSANTRDERASTTISGLHSTESCAVKSSVTAEKTSIAVRAALQSSAVHDPSRIYTAWWDSSSALADVTPHASAVEDNPRGAAPSHSSALTNLALGTVLASTDESAVDESTALTESALTLNSDSVEHAAVTINSVGSDAAPVNFNSVSHAES
jgi:hypothetical protein